MMTAAMARIKLQGTPLAVVAIIVVFLLTGGDGLLCYRCKNAKTNEECNNESNLVDCEKESTVTTRYDTCRTRVVKTIQDGILYSKDCVVGPCSLDGKQDVALGLDCDRSYPEWDCEYCCQEDRCNASGVEIISPTVATFWLTAVVSCLLPAVAWTTIG